MIFFAARLIALAVSEARREKYSVDFGRNIYVANARNRYRCLLPCSFINEAISKRYKSKLYRAKIRLIELPAFKRFDLIKDDRWDFRRQY